MTEAAPPPERAQSARGRLLDALSSLPVPVRDLSRAAGLSEREVIAHLVHLQKSLRAQQRQLVMTPPVCLDCRFSFAKRERLTRPGKCPVCRSTHLSEPLFSLESTPQPAKKPGA